MIDWWLVGYIAGSLIVGAIVGWFLGYAAATRSRG